MQSIRKRVRTELPFIGRNVVKLRLDYGDLEPTATTSEYPEPLDLTLQDCSQYIGASFKHLEMFRAPSTYMQNTFRLLRPILDKIEILSIWQSNLLQTEQEQEQECYAQFPNLKCLSLESGKDLMSLMSKCPPHLESLERFSILHHSMYNEPVVRFLAVNKRLKKLLLPLHHFTGLSKDILCTLLKIIEPILSLYATGGASEIECFSAECHRKHLSA